MKTGLPVFKSHMVAVDCHMLDSSGFLSESSKRNWNRPSLDLNIWARADGAVGLPEGAFPRRKRYSKEGDEEEVGSNVCSWAKAMRNDKRKIVNVFIPTLDEKHRKLLPTN